MPTNIFEVHEVLQELFKDYVLFKIVYRDSTRKYVEPQNPHELLVRVKEISMIFNRDMTFNEKSPYAEEYALCLVAAGRKEEALQLFDAIAGDKTDLLFLHNPLDHGTYISEIMSPTAEKLGYESMLRYASLLLIKNPQRAKKLLLEIAEKIPVRSFPGYIKDVRLTAIELLKDLGISRVNSAPIDEELAAARSHCY